MTAREALRLAADDHEAFADYLESEDLKRVSRETAAALRTLARRIDEEEARANALVGGYDKESMMALAILGRLDADLEGDAR
jgi:hypothetical protein